MLTLTAHLSLTSYMDIHVKRLVNLCVEVSAQGRQMFDILQLQIEHSSFLSLVLILFPTYTCNISPHTFCACLERVWG